MNIIKSTFLHVTWYDKKKKCVNDKQALMFGLILWVGLTNLTLIYHILWFMQSITIGLIRTCSNGYHANERQEK